MKNGTVMYEKIYRIIKNKIECGLLSNGSKLPSRAEMCREFGTSEKTIRHVVELLARDGLVETAQRKRPVITYDHTGFERHKELIPVRKADASAANDFLKTGILLCYPVIDRGMSLCTGEEWRIPEVIVAEMDPGQPSVFWRLSNKFWRFFICRNENEMILRAVDGLGLSVLEPLPGTWEARSDYHAKLKEFLETVKNGGAPESVCFKDMTSVYGTFREEARSCEAAPDSVIRTGAERFCRMFENDEERYSRVYLDILGLIALGRYKPGDQLPTHSEMRRIYNVSVDTTTKAVQLLSEWGVVTATPGKGIFVSLDLAAMSRIQIDPDLIACHIRRYLDSLELLSLTVGGVAAHAAASVTPEEAVRLRAEMEEVWEHNYLYQLSPIVLLEFLTEHIQYKSLQAIYRVILNNYHIGRSIPKLIHHSKDGPNRKIYKECLEAADLLKKGDSCLFSGKAAALFQDIHRLVLEECRRLGYYEAAMAAYDGSLFWK